MGALAKITTSVVVLILIAAAALAAWFYWAFTPKRYKTQEVPRQIVQENVRDGVIYSIVSYRIGPSDSLSYDVGTGVENDGLGVGWYLRVSGSPAPKEIRPAGNRRVEVVFAAPLQDGRSSLFIELEEDYRRNGTMIEVVDGVVQGTTSLPTDSATHDTTTSPSSPTKTTTK